ncbi:unnamed protein product, partial [Pylaiella littoralis]
TPTAAVLPRERQRRNKPRYFLDQRSPHRAHHNERPSVPCETKAIVVNQGTSGKFTFLRTGAQQQQDFGEHKREKIRRQTEKDGASSWWPFRNGGGGEKQQPRSISSYHRRLESH